MIWGEEGKRGYYLARLRNSNQLWVAVAWLLEPHLRSPAKSDLSHSEFSATFAYMQAYCEHMYDYFQ